MYDKNRNKSCSELGPKGQDTLLGPELSPPSSPDELICSQSKCHLSTSRRGHLRQVIERHDVLDWVPSRSKRNKGDVPSPILSRRDTSTTATAGPFTLLHCWATSPFLGSCFYRGTGGMYTRGKTKPWSWRKTMDPSGSSHCCHLLTRPRSSNGVLRSLDFEQVSTLPSPVASQA